MPTRTLAELRTAVANIASVTLSDTGRHTAAALNVWINDSIGRYYLALIDAGAPMRIARAVVSTSASTTATEHWPRNEYVELPEDLLRLRELNIIDADRTVTMLEFDSLESKMFEPDAGNQGTGLPLFYQLAISECGDVIARLLPKADAVYQIECIYTPGPRELTADTDKFRFLPGTVNFVVYEAAMSLLEFDGVEEGDQYQALRARRDEAFSTLQTHAGRMQQAGTTGMVNTRRMRAFNKRHHRGEDWVT